ncbi:hypothetical protein MVEN_00794500 [Mycena venus]|uniref:Uncharacterized protein n=1 Tax=Mycena venus TaxID=2733690 RepID=A0A8H7D6I0_9AGAR|nr:hypothetical protein MVEN_00794500 [Mycena venus]
MHLFFAYLATANVNSRSARGGLPNIGTKRTEECIDHLHEDVQIAPFEAYHILCTSCNKWIASGPFCAGCATNGSAFTSTTTPALYRFGSSTTTRRPSPFLKSITYVPAKASAAAMASAMNVEAEDCKLAISPPSMSTGPSHYPLRPGSSIERDPWA